MEHIICCYILFTSMALGYPMEFHDEVGDDWNIAVDFDNDHNRKLYGRLANHVTPNEIAAGIWESYEEGFTVTWPGNARLNVQSRYDAHYDVTCQDITWVAEDCRQQIFEDCYSLDGVHWYGGGPIYQMEWPIEKWSLDFSPMVTGDTLSSQEIEFGGVVERYWLNSDGFAFFVDWEVPLWVSINSSADNQICFRSTYDDSPYHNIDESPLFLNYSVCQADDMKEMHTYAVNTHLGKPLDIPDELLFRYPIYSTWARYSDAINQTLVLDFAHEINHYNFSNAQMEIDDDWELSYGRLDFNPEKFPDPKAMVDELESIGFRTTLWVHPFVNLNTDYIWIGGLQFAYMKDPGGLLPALTTWWRGVAATVDYTDQGALDWWVAHLTELQLNYGIDSFKFDAGETNWLPASYVPAVPFRNPSDYSTIYVEMAYNVDPDVRHQEVRTGARTQHVPIYTRLLDKDSRWGYDNGLQTVIPHVLLYSVLGYVFPLPDMIGGNAYGEFPDRELFIRWTQLNVFLPGFQFSIVPWQYDEQVITICRDMLTLHENHADLMIQLGRNSTVTGEPIVRPLWWVSPNDPEAQTIDSEFLVGNDLLSAPVMDPGATTRDIYLPGGQWRDMNDPGTVLEGAQWYPDYPAPLHILPYFMRV